MSIAGTVLRLLPGSMRNAVRAWVEYRRYRRRFTSSQPRRLHTMPGELIVSLTSYPPRFATLAYTLKSLLHQTTRPDRIVLWIASSDVASLPKAVKKLVGADLEIRSVPDVGSYKKLVYALQEFPSAFIATCDDDVFYGPDWLAELVAAQAGNHELITCHRAHRVRRLADGSFGPYRDWEWDVQDAKANQPSIDLVPTGVGGVLYPPGCFASDVTESERFLTLAPNADDLWFYWCARRKGTTHLKAGMRFPLLYFAASQDHSLWSVNATGNDKWVAALLAAYGDPLRKC